MSRKAKLSTMLSLALATLLWAVVPLPARADAALADGTYLVEVMLEGGSGRANVDSPTALVVENGQATATITWSSPNYDYMVVAGETYHPVNTEGNSTFEIPVLAFDEPFDVIGDTTAMSVPHEIDYQLTFVSESITPAEVEDGPRGTGMLPVACGLALVAAAGCAVLVIRRRAA